MKLAKLLSFTNFMKLSILEEPGPDNEVKITSKNLAGEHGIGTMAL